MPTEIVDDAPAASGLTPGSRFGRYEVVRKLGEGGMGAVYEARREDLDKRVALKVLTLGGTAEATARFVQEARISAGLEHPNVAACFDVGEHEGTPYLALEFLDGETLGARMARGPMGAAEVADVLLPVCSALAMAHGRGVVHRDLKPDNVFLARQVGAVVPKVLDFGIAKATAGAEPQGLTRTAAIMGTPGFMSPEQARDSKSVGPATDQFALGVILWEALAGRGLFVGASAIDVLMKVMTEAAPPLRAVQPDVDPALEALVGRLLEKDPARRLGSMREVGAALLPFASPDVRARWVGEFLDAPPEREVAAAPVEVRAPTTREAAPPVASPPAPRGRRGLVVAVACLLALLLLLGVWRPWGDERRAVVTPDAPAAPSATSPAADGSASPASAANPVVPASAARPSPSQGTAAPAAPSPRARHGRGPHGPRRAPHGGRWRRR